MHSTMALPGALQQAQAILAMMGGVLLWEVSGVKTYINERQGEMWMEMQPGFCPLAYETILTVLEHAGYELMWDEIEGIEMYDDGRVRNWLNHAPVPYPCPT